MRTKLMCAVLALGGVVTIGLSKDRPSIQTAHRDRDRGEFHGREAAEGALRKYYGDTTQTHIEGPGVEVNGVRVFDVKVITREGATAQVTITSGGDYITMGNPDSIENLPAGARETARLFRAPPLAVTREDIHAFYVLIKGPDLRPCVVEFDAAGRIRDIKTGFELREEAAAPRVAGPDAQRIADMTARRFGNMEVDGIFAAIHDPGYYNVTFHAKHGRGSATISLNEDVIEWHYPIARTELPDAVQRSLEREIRAERILGVQTGASRLYRIVQVVGGENISYLVKPDGAVQWMSSRELHRHWEQH